MEIPKKIFKAYDIRGVYPNEINEDAVYKIAQAYAEFVKPKKVALGRDVRLSGPSLWEAAKNGLVDYGVEVTDIGVITTDMLYFATAHYGFDGGITISASHNPKEYNGMKMVRKDAVPISGDSGIKEIAALVQSGFEKKSEQKGQVVKLEIRQDYVKKCLSLIDAKNIKPMRVVANAMFGPALEVVHMLGLPLSIVDMNETPDGNFPKGQPDPSQEKNRKETVATILAQKPDIGVAWDADADRFFLFDENGRFIPGYYLTAFLGEHFASQLPWTKVVCDARLIWAVKEKVEAYGGEVLLNKAGHSFIKERMRSENAVFGGEMSGHYYFKDFYFADNGLIPFLMVLEIVSKSQKKVSELFNDYFKRFPISGEINQGLSSQADAAKILAEIEKKYPEAKIEKIDGLSLECSDWRANIRTSNTEPLLRLNVEAKNEALMKEKTAELLQLMGS